MGTPVTFAIDNALPPFASQSSFVSMMPSMWTCLPNSLICSEITLPAVLSPMNIVMFGLHTRTIFSISLIRLLFVSCLPALSMSTVCMPTDLACAIASNATLAGSAPYLLFMMGTPILFACSSNCSIAAARNVSLAASTELIP